MGMEPGLETGSDGSMGLNPGMGLPSCGRGGLGNEFPRIIPGLAWSVLKSGMVGLLRIPPAPPPAGGNAGRGW